MGPGSELSTTFVPEIMNSGETLLEKAKRLALAAGKKTLAVVGVTLAAGSLASCSSEKVEASPIQYETRGIKLSVDLAHSRQDILALCETSDDASMMEEEWNAYGFNETTGLDWKNAYRYMVDFEYEADPNTIITSGEIVYPTTNEFAKNCEEAAFLLTRTLDISGFPPEAQPAIEAYRADPADLIPDIMQSMANSIADKPTASAQ